MRFVHTNLRVRDSFVADPDGYRTELIDGDLETPQDPD